MYDTTYPHAPCKYKLGYENFCRKTVKTVGMKV
jgi:hypothetical protein